MLEPADVHVGLEASFEREITSQDIMDFARISGDANPLHVDESYATDTNYARRIAHGAFQVGLASAMLGMFLPGRKVLLMSTQARFPHPLFFPGSVRVQGTVVSWSGESLKGMLKVFVTVLNTGVVTAEVFMGFTFHDRVPARASAAVASTPRREESSPLVFVTGAAGGLGREIAQSLAGQYHVVAVTNRQPIDEELRSLPSVSELQLPLSSPDWEERAEAWLSGRRVLGVVHAAWPAVPQGGLLDTSDEALDQQLQFGGPLTVRLARFLAKTAATDGGRLVVIGSVYGTVRPTIGFAAYSLGKGLLEHTIRLLAPELARKHITVNAVNPSVVPIGMNSRLNERQRLRETAQVPMGRLCDPSDVSAAVEFLLSPRAAFISGEALTLDGGQL